VVLCFCLGKKNKASKATNPQQHMAEKQQMSERNVVQVRIWRYCQVLVYSYV